MKKNPKCRSMHNATADIAHNPSRVGRGLELQTQVKGVKNYRLG